LCVVFISLNYFVKDKLAIWMILGTLVAIVMVWEWGEKRQAAQIPTTPPPAGEGQLPPPAAAPSITPAP
jgi:hypothetical protein